MFPPLSLQAPYGGFNINVGFFVHVPPLDDALYKALLYDIELVSARLFFFLFAISLSSSS
jgi:hypothetical protein